MAQNAQHWLFDLDRYAWAREHVSATKWFQITKYFPGYKLRRQMMYVDAESGDAIAAEGGEIVPPGKVYIYGYDLRNFCGVDVPGLDEAMQATRRSRVAQRAAHGDTPVQAAPGAAEAAPATTSAPAGGAHAPGAPGAPDAPAAPSVARSTSDVAGVAGVAGVATVAGVGSEPQQGETTNPPGA